MELTGPNASSPDPGEKQGAGEGVSNYPTNITGQGRTAKSAVPLPSLSQSVPRAADEPRTRWGPRLQKRA